MFRLRCFGENRSKIGDFAPTRSIWPKISGRRGRPPPIIFAWIVRPMNAPQLCCWQFSQKKLCSRLSSREVRFQRENGRFAFWAPLGDLWATYDDHPRLIGKRVVDFLLVLIEHFSLGRTAEALRDDYWFKIGDFAPTRASWAKISGRRGRPLTNRSSFRKPG